MGMSDRDLRFRDDWENSLYNNATRTTRISEALSASRLEVTIRIGGGGLNRPKEALLTVRDLLQMHQQGIRSDVCGSTLLSALNYMGITLIFLY